MKTLISLKEYNEKAKQNYPTQETKLNGIACPECGKELHDVQPNIVLNTYPPQKYVKCLDGCQYIGHRIV